MMKSSKSWEHERILRKKNKKKRNTNNVSPCLTAAATWGEENKLRRPKGSVNERLTTRLQHFFLVRTYNKMGINFPITHHHEASFLIFLFLFVSRLSELQLINNNLDQKVTCNWINFPSFLTVRSDWLCLCDCVRSPLTVSLTHTHSGCRTTQKQITNSSLPSLPDHPSLFAR